MMVIIQSLGLSIPSFGHDEARTASFLAFLFKPRGHSMSWLGLIWDVGMAIVAALVVLRIPSFVSAP